MPGPKVVILGAGSLFFGRKAIWQMVHSKHLNAGTLALVDTDADRLAKMKKLAQMVVAHNGVPLKIEASTDRRDVLPGADFIILSFADRNAHFRGVDVDTSAKYGIRMCSGDTIGPGGIFRAMREQPQIEAAAKDIRELCPDAWLINYINPTTVHGMMLARFFPQLKSIALCDAQWGLRRNMARLAEVPDDDKLILQPAGPNHFTWLLRAEYDGRDITGKIVAGIRAMAEDVNKQAQGGKSQAKGWHNNSIAIELYEAFGILPTVLGHTKEYVRFYQGRSATGLDKHPALKLFEVPDRVKWTNSVWERVDAYVTGKVDIAEFDTEFGSDPATDVVEAMAGGLGKRFFINTFNRGAVTNMADDAFIEMYCDLDMKGPRPVPIDRAMPRGVRGMCETILDTHELTAEAIFKRDPALLRRAMLTDPLTHSIGDTDALIAELLDRERDALPGCWFETADA